LSEDGRTIDARIIDASVSGIRLESPLSISAGSLIKVEWQDTLLLGEVLYSQSAGSSTVLGIELTRALYGMSELRRLNANLTGATQGAAGRQADVVAAVSTASR